MPAGWQQLPYNRLSPRARMAALSQPGCLIGKSVSQERRCLYSRIVGFRIRRPYGQTPSCRTISASASRARSSSQSAPIRLLRARVSRSAFGRSQAISSTSSLAVQVSRTVERRPIIPRLSNCGRTPSWRLVEQRHRQPPARGITPKPRRRYLPSVRLAVGKPSSRPACVPARPRRVAQRTCHQPRVAAPRPRPERLATCGSTDRSAIEHHRRHGFDDHSMRAPSPPIKRHCPRRPRPK